MGSRGRKSVLWVIFSFYGEPAASLAESAMRQKGEKMGDLCQKRTLRPCNADVLANAKNTF